MKRLEMSEDDLLKGVLQMARLFKWLSYHARPAMLKNGSWRTAVSGDGKGFPDVVLLRDNRCLAWELKASKGKATPEQTNWLQAFKRAGWEARIIRPEDWHSGTIERLLK